MAGVTVLFGVGSMSPHHGCQGEALQRVKRPFRKEWATACSGSFQPAVPAKTASPRMRSWRDGSGSGCGHFLGPPKLRAVSPDAVQDHSDLAGNSNARLLRSNALGQPCPPSFERGPTLHLREKDIGGLVKARSSEPISAFRDVALPICFPGLISSRCQPEIGSYIAGPSELAGRDCRKSCARGRVSIRF